MNQSESLLESMTLYPSKVKWILILLGSILFLLLGIVSQGQDYDLVEAWIGQFLCLLSLIGICISLITLWPNSSWLKLGPDGLRYRALFRKFYYPWSDINQFDITIVDTGYTKEKLVSFWIQSNDKMHSLHDSFGKKPEQLLEILENYRKKYN